MVGEAAVGMSDRIVFVTQELEPLVPGGAATVIAGLRERLAVSHRIGVLLAAPGTPSVTGPDVEVVEVPTSDGTIGWFVERSRRLAIALAESHRRDPIDLVEFTDFEATALWTMAHRQELGLERVRLAVRFHGPIEAVIAAIGVAPPLFAALGRLERAVLGAADAVLVPSAAVGEWAVERYGLEPERVVVAPPPVPDISPVERRPAPQPHLVVFGRLAEQKGTHDLAAVLPDVLEAFPDLTIAFIGADGWSFTEDRRMSAVLLESIPTGQRSRVELLGPLPRPLALARMADAWAVVLPSRFETFCLAAHEVRRAGLAVIAPDLPAFAAFRIGAGILVYDGTRPGLTAVLGAAAGDRDLMDRLAAEPVPEVGDPGAAYRSALPSVRHPRSQAGLSTRCVGELEAALRSPAGAGDGVARRLLRLLPTPVARLAVRLVPRRLKDRFRRVASWPEEEERRRREEKLRNLRRRARHLAALPEPRVTVVIPCFDSGAWVEDAVASVFAQTFDSWDIVLVDDGSTDPASIRILDAMAAWPRVRLVRQPNAGLPAARNAGIATARGEFVVPLDADDELEPEYLEGMLGALLAAPGAAFAHCWARLFGDVDAVWVPRPDNPYWQRLGNGIVGCVLLRRAAWEAVGGYDATMRRGHEDWEMWLRLEAAGWGRTRVDRPLFRYRKRAGSMSVFSEAGFEAGLAEIRQRHPGLYTAAALRALKREWYPVVSVVSARRGAGEHPDEVEFVDSFGRARGKYLIDLGEQDVDDAALLAAAHRLETTPAAAGAAVGPGVVMWRRWALLDSASGLFGVLDGSPDAVPEATPHPDWTVDASLVPPGIGVLRQRPEEAGWLPDWVVEE
jgi:glycosyltransferase involved in cell wall biosynthesis